MSEYRIGDEVHIKGTIVKMIRVNPLESGWINGLGVLIENENENDTYTFNIDLIKDQITHHTRVIKEGDKVQWYVSQGDRSGYYESGVVEAVSKNRDYAFINYRSEMKSLPVAQLTRLNDNGV